MLDASEQDGEAAQQALAAARTVIRHIDLATTHASAAYLEAQQLLLADGDGCDAICSREVSRQTSCYGGGAGLASRDVVLAVGVSTVQNGVAALGDAYREASQALGRVAHDGGVLSLPFLEPTADAVCCV